MQRGASTRRFVLDKEAVIAQGSIIRHGPMLELDMSSPAGKTAEFTLTEEEEAAVASDREEGGHVAWMTVRTVSVFPLDSVCACVVTRRR
jgi:hypothetical protein